jgi:hypothetical protein
MKVKKRDGSLEEMRYDKITKRISILCHDLNMEYIDPTYVTLKVTQGIYDGISTIELDKLAAETAVAMTTTHPDYSKLAGRIEVSSLHKSTPKKFSQCIKELHSFVEPRTGKQSSLIDTQLYKFVLENKDVIDSAIVMDRDFDFDYFGIKTLERSYLIKIGQKIVERPQYLYMRVALGICNFNLEEGLRIYDDLSQHYYTHATPTLFNAGTPRPQMSSCFLIGNKGDDIDGLFNTLGDVAKISKWAGGIGLHVHDVRAKGSYIKGTGGESDGLLPMMKTYNEVARWINQCFESDTLIHTKDGKKSIGDLTEEDYVLTMDGTFHQVYSNDTFDYNGELLNFETTNGNATLKGDHPMLVIQNVSDKTDDEIKKLMKLNVIKPIWIDAEKISDKDIILSY